MSEALKDLLSNEPDVYGFVLDTLLRYANNVLENPSNGNHRRILIDSPEIASMLPVKGAIDCIFSLGFEEELEVNFYSQLQAYSKEVLRLEEPFVLESAKRCIPISDILQRAKEMLNNLPPLCNESSPQSKINEPGLQDCVLVELLKWFKECFYSWVDKPECDSCKGTTESIGYLSPISEELEWDVSRVEGYRCSLCAKVVRFPRHNHPLMLLKTRRGRCGEWAKCFTLCCRAMSLEARLVYDWTDHVWTEVYSVSQHRWIHADPCENISDQPLIYESGWKKKLSYVIAFSQDEVVDVTWRYSSLHAEVLQRRLLCREAWLLDTLNKFNAARQHNWSPGRKTLFLERTATELVEFLCPRTASSSELTGRISGSLAWRLSRAEVSPVVRRDPYIFTVCSKEVESKIFHVKYSSAMDKYVRVSDGNKEMKSWSSVVYQSQNITLKVEHDWKMSYLARTEGSDTASITWQFDFSSCNLKIDSIELCYKSSVFEDGLVAWQLCSGEKCLILPAGGIYKSISEMQDCKKLALEARLSRGKGSCAWQHTQLFRQSLNNVDEYPFEVKIVLI